MGKKEKEKKKKGKHEGEKGSSFTIPKPPPWPLPAWLQKALAARGKGSGATPSDPVSHAVPATAVTSAPSDTGSGAKDEGLSDAAPPLVQSAAEGESAQREVVESASFEAAESASIEAAEPDEDVPSSDPESAEGELETTDMADIADIAPVGPAGLVDDAAAGASSIDGSLAEDTHAAPTVEELTQQIRELESRLDRMLDEQRAGTPAPAPRSSGANVTSRAPDLEWTEHAGPPSASSAHDLLSSEFYLRQWGRTGMRRRAEEVDELGFDPAYEERYRPFIDFLYRYYFRVDTQGVSQIPSQGRCVIVANHAGGPLPYDGLMLRAAVRREHDAKRDLRWLAEDFVFYLPFVGASLNRLGAVRACQENAERLLSRERLVAVFPEGAKGIGKLFGERYRLQRFGRGGFIRLCLRTNTPIVPCAVVGAEEANPTVYRVESLAKILGLPYLPVTPTFPALGPLGLLPAPTKWKIRFGEPMRFTHYGPEAADDDLLVMRLTEAVRTVIQDMLSSMLAKRRSIWLG